MICIVIRNLFSGHLEENKNRNPPTITIKIADTKNENSKNVVHVDQINKMDTRHPTLLSDNNNEHNFQSFRRTTGEYGYSQTASPRSTEEKLPTREQLSQLRTANIQKDNEVP